MSPEQTEVLNTLTRRILPCRWCDAFTLTATNWALVPAPLLERLIQFHGLRKRSARDGLCEPCQDKARRDRAAGNWPDHEVALDPRLGRWENFNGIQKWVPYRRRRGAA